MIAGGGVRAVLELAGIRDILAKSLGTTNPINMAKATVNGLKHLRRPDEVARSRGLTIKEVLPYKAPKRSRRWRRSEVTQVRSQIGQSREAPRHAPRARARQDRQDRRARRRPGLRRHASEGPPSRQGRQWLKISTSPRSSPLRPGRTASVSVAATARARAATPAAASRARSPASGSHKMRAGFEGGQMPIYMRLGKLRGATSKDAMPIGPFRTSTAPDQRRLARPLRRRCGGHAGEPRREGAAEEHEDRREAARQRRAEEEADRSRARDLRDRAREGREGGWNRRRS